MRSRLPQRYNSSAEERVSNVLSCIWGSSNALLFPAGSAKSCMNNSLTGEEIAGSTYSVFVSATINEPRGVKWNRNCIEFAQFWGGRQTAISVWPSGWSKKLRYTLQGSD